MATEDLKSTNITARDATPPTQVDGQFAVRKSTYGYSACAVKDVGSIYRLCSIPSNARRVQVVATVLGGCTAGAADVGIYQVTENGGAVVDADFFASALSLITAIPQGQDITFESGVNTIAHFEEPLWHALGLAADPGIMYDIVATTSTAVTVAATGIGITATFS